MSTTDITEDFQSALNSLTKTEFPYTKNITIYTTMNDTLQKNNRSESIKELAAALAKCQGAMRAAEKDRENHFFKSSYSTLAAVWDACRKPMSDNGLAIVQMPTLSEEGVVLESILMHSSGEWISSVLKLNPVKQDPQGIGSCLSYARRYSVSAMVGVCSGDDAEDDGNADAMPIKGRATPVTPSTPAETTEETKSEAAMKVAHLEKLFETHSIDVEKARDYLHAFGCESLGDVPDATIAKIEKNPEAFKKSVEQGADALKKSTKKA